MSGLHSIYVVKSHRDAVRCGDFVKVWFVQANKVAYTARVYNGSTVVGWVEGGN